MWNLLGRRGSLRGAIRGSGHAGQTAGLQVTPEPIQSVREAGEPLASCAVHLFVFFDNTHFDFDLFIWLN